MGAEWVLCAVMDLNPGPDVTPCLSNFVVTRGSKCGSRDYVKLLKVEVTGVSCDERYDFREMASFDLMPINLSDKRCDFREMSQSTCS